MCSAMSGRMPNVNHDAGVDVSARRSGIFWDSGLWIWLTGDSLSKPMYRPDRGYWPDQLSRDH
jgi:hypothetical protein